PRARARPSTRRPRARRAGIPRPAGPPTSLRARRRAGSFSVTPPAGWQRPPVGPRWLLYLEGKARAGRGQGRYAAFPAARAMRMWLDGNLGPFGLHLFLDPVPGV